MWHGRLAHALSRKRCCPERLKPQCMGGTPMPQECNASRMIMTRRIGTFVGIAFVATLLLAGCNHHEPQYGTEIQLAMPGLKRQVWAVAPTIDLSGENVDPLLQS